MQKGHLGGPLEFRLRWTICRLKRTPNAGGNKVTPDVFMPDRSLNAIALPHQISFRSCLCICLFHAYLYCKSPEGLPQCQTKNKSRGP
jgi:hypothetical protein